MKMQLGTYRPIYGRTKSGKFSSPSKAGKVFGSIWYWTKWTVVGASLVVVTYGYVTAESANTVYAQNVIVVAPKAEAMAPVLQRIADCESGNGKPGSGTHYKNGQVVMRANDVGTSIDIGKYQINYMYWSAKATEMGLDLTKEEDNYKMAKYIYENKGTGDWVSSAHCWQK